MRDYLTEFWVLLGGKKNDGFDHPEQKKITLLATMSMIRLGKVPNDERREKRKDFFERRNEVHSLQQYPNCFCCGMRNVTRHHIIQLKNGGPNTGRNIVSICPKCDKKVHPWLAELTPMR